MENKIKKITTEHYGKCYDALELGLNQTVDGDHVSMDQFDMDNDISEYTRSEFIDMCIECFGNDFTDNLNS